MNRSPQQRSLMGDRCIICGRSTPDLGRSPGRRIVYRNSEGTLVRDNVFRHPRSQKDWKPFGWTHIGCWGRREL